MSSAYNRNARDIIQELASDAEFGLASERAAERLRQHGPNELIDRGTRGIWAILWEQLTGWLVVLLIVSAAISAYLGDMADTIAIVTIVVLNAALGLRQEYRAERAMAALKRMAAPSVRVRRDGRILEIPSRELVPGDIVLLEAGNLVPADGRLFECVNLRVQESALTGESEPVEKSTDAIVAGNAGIGDRHNMVHLGTVVTYGRGAAVVTATGMKTELGAIANLLQSVAPELTPLQRKLDHLGKQLVVAAVALVAIIFTLGMIRGEPWHLMFLTAVSMAVAAVPEGLPAVVTIALALGAQRMLKRRTLIRKLPAVESLGAVTVICSDKTGTLTQNRMTVTMLDVAGDAIDLTEQLHDATPVLENTAVRSVIPAHPGTLLLLAGAALCNDAVLQVETGEHAGLATIGDPTEGALLIAAAQHSLDKRELDAAFPRISEAPFDSVRKRMTTVHDLRRVPRECPTPIEALAELLRAAGAHSAVAFTKGAVDGLLEISSFAWRDRMAAPLDAVTRARINETNARFAARGMRVLGVAMRFMDARDPADSSGGRAAEAAAVGKAAEAARVSNVTDSLPLLPLREHDLIFIGLIAMIDPARPEARDAVATCQAAGIRPIMITGDHPLTARHIAEELGLPNTDRVVTGAELEATSLAALEGMIDTVSVFARVSPEHKLKIVEALQDKGHIVAMTGDGVNDAPALKKADIGVAMGITGTDVSKEAADMVLLDDNFASIVAAVEEGRVIYDNIRKFLKYLLTSNSGELWVMLAAPFLGMPLPLMPIQILWINLVTDGLPALALGVEPGERFIMRRPPYPPDQNIFAKGLGRHVLVIGMLMGIVPLAAGYVLWRSGEAHWQTMLFTVLTLSQMGHAMAVRSDRDSLFTIGIFSNKPLIGSVALTFAMQMAILYIPAFHEFFHIEPLPFGMFALAMALSLVVFGAVEMEKAVKRNSEPANPSIKANSP